MGRATSVQARATACTTGSSGSPLRSIRSIFSTMTTEPSTSSPRAIARPPRDIRLAEISKYLMRRNAKAKANGMAASTTTLGLSPPSMTNWIIIMRKIASYNALVTVLTHFSTRVA